MTDEILYEEKRRLPVWSVVAGNYGYLWRQRALLGAPLGLFLLLQILAGAGGILVARLTFRGHAVMSVFYGIAVLAVSIAFAVGLHRTILLDEVKSGSAFFRWNRYWQAYVGTWLRLMGLFVAAMLVLIIVMAVVLAVTIGVDKLSYLLVLSAFLPLLLAYVFFARLGLAFPGASVGVEKPIASSWRMTSGYWGRMLAITALILIPLTLASLATSLPQLIQILAARGQIGVAGTGLPMDWSPLTIAALLANAAIRTLTGALVTVALSLSFGALSPEKTP